MRIGVYAGSFDPLTNGHLDIILRSLKLFDRLIIAVTRSAEKEALFTVEERKEMIRTVIASDERIEIDTFDGLLVEYARSRTACALVRGLRAFSDFEYEFRMALTNRNLAPDIETIFLMPSEKSSYISSSLIKEIVSLGGTVKNFVPPGIEERLRKKYAVH